MVVFTSDLRLAGTDADVSIKLFGDDGALGPVVLTTASADIFQRGTEDEFMVSGAPMGKVSKLEIGHNNKGTSTSWHLDRVEVTCPDVSPEETLVFVCRQWFDSSQVGLVNF